MKNLLLIFSMVALFSCAKTVETNNSSTQIASPKTVNGSPDSSLVINLGNSVLKAVVEPVLTCYTTNNGETPKPCIVYVYVNFTLSNPLNRYIKVTVQRSNLAEDHAGNYPLQPTEMEGQGQNVVFTLAPNQTKFSFRSPFTNESNVIVPDGRYRITNATLFDMVD